MKGPEDIQTVTSFTRIPVWHRGKQHTLQHKGKIQSSRNNAKDIFMRKALIAICISLLWAASLGSAYADPVRAQVWRQKVRVERQQRFIERQGTARREQFQRQWDGRRGVAPNRPVFPGPAALESNQFSVAPYAPRRPGRLTPEERQALRRQINEAGREIYAPRR